MIRARRVPVTVTVILVLLACSGAGDAPFELSPVRFTGDLSIRFQHYEPVVRQRGLVAYWPFNEGSGYECIDWSGNGLTGYMTGSRWNTENSGLTSAYRKKGKRSGCIYLDGTQWIQVRHTGLLDFQKSFTLAAWIKPDVLKDAEIISKYGNRTGYLLALGSDGSFSFKAGGKDPTVMTSGKDLIVPGKWQHIGVAVHARSKTISLFLNGRMIDLVHNGRIADRVPRGWSGIEASAPDLHIGGSPAAGSCFQGLIDDVCFFEDHFREEDMDQLCVSGLPEIYTQARATIDDSLSVWSRFYGNHPVPHPAGSDARMILRFDGNAHSTGGQVPQNDIPLHFIPGTFGGAWLSAQSECGLKYRSPYEGNKGTFEGWVRLAEGAAAVTTEASPLVHMTGRKSSVELWVSSEEALVRFMHDQRIVDSLSVRFGKIPSGELFHLGFTWEPVGNTTTFRVYLNGVPAGMKEIPFSPGLADGIWIGGNSGKNFNGTIDDICCSPGVKGWGEVCPTGHIDSESPSLDMMTGFDDLPNGPLMHWKPGSGRWKYAVKEWDRAGEGKCIEQRETEGLSTLFHPVAYGYNSSVESAVSAGPMHGGWMGLFVQSPGPQEDRFSGHTFMIHMGNGQLRLATYRGGERIREKILENDHAFVPERVYGMTLTASGGLLRGHVDGRNVISMEAPPGFQNGYSGLITENGSACFDDIHFTALTRPEKRSRKIEARIIAQEGSVSFREFSLNAFRWKKRYGLLPWHRNYKNPEPPGNIFGPDDKTERPNPSARWRSEDAANSAVVYADGTFHYLMRGNPDINGMHGNAQIGYLWRDAGDFDGLHFNDPALSVDNNEVDNNEVDNNEVDNNEVDNNEVDNNAGTHILRGHPDTNRGNCSDDPPRDDYFQLNDQGSVYLDGKLIMVCREFRNSNARSNKFKRLVLGVFDTGSRSWVSEEPFVQDWSYMDPDSCYGRMHGLDGTPEIGLLRDPDTDEFIILLYHHASGKHAGDPGSTGSYQSFNEVSGFRYTGITLDRHEKYPPRAAIGKQERVGIFGERLLFDNGIWYLNINAHSKGLRRDWPDRYELYSSIDPYRGPWQASGDNDRPYFERGDEFDPDNGAIWQGAMLKYRNRYYMYYENYHVIDDTEMMYEHYNHPQSGSRVGYAVAN